MITYRWVKGKEEHCSIVMYPGEEYLGHCSPEKGTGKCLADCLLKFFNDHDIDLSQLSALMSDGCSKMLGWDKGTHAFIESQLERPLQRIVCFLHHLEKPYEHLFIHFDGKTTGPYTYSGPIGKQIEGDASKLPVDNLKVGGIPKDDFRKLSTD